MQTSVLPCVVNLKRLLRDDLRILLMSATLEAKAISALLDDAPMIESEGRTYPVETHYLLNKAVGRIENAVVASIQQALQAHDGSCLSFCLVRRKFIVSRTDLQHCD